MFDITHHDERLAGHCIDQKNIARGKSRQQHIAVELRAGVFTQKSETDGGTVVADGDAALEVTEKSGIEGVLIGAEIQDVVFAGKSVVGLKRNLIELVLDLGSLILVLADEDRAVITNPQAEVVAKARRVNPQLVVRRGRKRLRVRSGGRVIDFKLVQGAVTIEIRGVA